MHCKCEFVVGRNIKGTGRKGNKKKQVNNHKNNSSGREGVQECDAVHRSSVPPMRIDKGP